MKYQEINSTIDNLANKRMNQYNQVLTVMESGGHSEIGEANSIEYLRSMISLRDTFLRSANEYSIEERDCIEVKLDILDKIHDSIQALERRYDLKLMNDDWEELMEVKKKLDVDIINIEKGKSGNLLTRVKTSFQKYKSK